jgi:hypothetical protein
MYNEKIAALETIKGVNVKVGLPGFLKYVAF